MKLVQNLKLMPDNSITTWLAQHIPSNSTDVFLAGPYELSFHPFDLCAWAFQGFHITPPQPMTDIAFSWNISIIDDEEKKALMNLNSKNRVLLMLSELFTGLHECCSCAAFVIEKIEPELKTHMLNISLKISAGTQDCTMVAGALCLKAALDSMLFCRGLALGRSVFESKDEGPSLTLLKDIFLAQF